MLSPEMRIRVLYFGILKELRGREGEEFELAAGDSVETLLRLVRERGMEQSELWRSIAVAVNREYARTDTLLQDGDEVALLPPVSGGLRENGEVTRRVHCHH